MLDAQMYPSNRLARAAKEDPVQREYTGWWWGRESEEAGFPYQKGKQTIGQDLELEFFTALLFTTECIIRCYIRRFLAESVIPTTLLSHPHSSCHGKLGVSRFKMLHTDWLRRLSGRTFPAFDWTSLFSVIGSVSLISMFTIIQCLLQFILHYTHIIRLMNNMLIECCVLCIHNFVHVLNNNYILKQWQIIQTFPFFALLHIKGFLCLAVAPLSSFFDWIANRSSKTESNWAWFLDEVPSEGNSWS